MALVTANASLGTQPVWETKPQHISDNSLPHKQFGREPTETVLSAICGGIVNYIVDKKHKLCYNAVVMSETNTKTKNIVERLHQAGLHLGLMSMAAATTMATFEGLSHRAVLPAVPALATVGVDHLPTEHGGQGHERSAREEVHPQHSSYGISQRTPSRSSK